MVTVYFPLTWGMYTKPPPDIPECGFMGELCREPIPGQSLYSFDNRLCRLYCVCVSLLILSLYYISFIESSSKKLKRIVENKHKEKKTFIHWSEMFRIEKDILAGRTAKFTFWSSTVMLFVLLLVLIMVIQFQNPNPNP